MFQEINFSPYRTNVLDCVGRKGLVTEDGQPVSIQRSMTGTFVVTIGEQTFTTDDNITASRILNNFPVGCKRP